MGWDNDCIGVGMGLGYVFGNNSSSNNNKPEMWGWDGILLALGCMMGMNTFMYFEYYYVSNIFTEWI